jgi:hypothetical protein
LDVEERSLEATLRRKRTLKQTPQLDAGVKNKQTPQLGAEPRERSSTDEQIISRFLSDKVRQIVSDLTKGLFTVQHVRDLADAAVYGSADAALVLGRISLAARKSDSERPRAEALAWLATSLLLGADKRWAASAREQLKKLRAESTESTNAEAERIFAEIKTIIRKTGVKYRNERPR